MRELNQLQQFDILAKIIRKVSSLPSRGNINSGLKSLSPDIRKLIENGLEGNQPNQIRANNRDKIGIVLESLVINNWRGYLGENTIEFSTDKDKSVTTIIAENQTGKSGILEAIHWVLYDDIPVTASNSDNLINDFAEQQDSKATTEVILKLINKDDEKYELTRKKVSELSDSDIYIKKWDESSKTYEPHICDPVSFIEQNILFKNLREIFLFRGEDLMASFQEKDSEKLKKAVNNTSGVTFQIYAKEAIDIFIEKIDDEISKQNSQDSRTKKAWEKYEKAQNAFDDVKDLYDKYSEKLKKLTDKESKLIKKIGKDSGEEVKEASENLLKIKPHIKNKKTLVNIKKDEIKGLIKTYAFNCFTADNLNQLTEIEEEDEQIEDLEFFKGLFHPHRKTDINEILNKGVCICGRDLNEGDEYYENVAEIMREANSEEEVQARENISILANTNKDILKDFHINYNSKTSDLAGLEGDYERLCEQRDEYEETLDQGDTDDPAKQLLKKEKEDVQVDIKKFKGLRDDANIKMYVAEENLKSLKPKKPKNSGNSQTQELDEIIKSARDMVSILADHSNEAEKDTKAKLSEVLNHYADEYSTTGSEFKFENDSYVPELVSPATGIESGLSSGGKRMKALFFGTSLVETVLSRINDADVPFIEPGAMFPFICDAPFSDLDGCNEDSAAEMVASLKCQKIILVHPKAYTDGVKEKLEEMGLEGARYFVERHITTKAGRKVTGRTHHIDNDIYTPFHEESDKEGSTIRRVI